MSDDFDLQERPVILGVTGGIGSGKSAVADLLVECGAARFDADVAGHQALRNDEVKAALVDRWGAGIVGNDGELIRTRIGDIVFQDSGELRFLESVSHPVIKDTLLSAITEAKANDSLIALAVDAALLLEKSWDENCDLVLFVDCDDEMRWNRCEMRGWTREQFAARESAQMPITQKREQSDVVFSNSGALDELRSQINAFWSVLNKVHA